MMFTFCLFNKIVAFLIYWFLFCCNHFSHLYLSKCIDHGRLLCLCDTVVFELHICVSSVSVQMFCCVLQYTWPSHNKEMMMLYHFDYLPAGLFNRVQVL